MKPTHLAICACAALLAACGGGGDTLPAAAASDPLAQSEQVVVRYDLNGDDELDTITIDRDGRIVEALESAAGGDPVDTTDARRGQAIDPRIAEAIEAHLSNSVAVASETRLDVVDSMGRTVPVTVFE